MKIVYLSGLYRREIQHEINSKSKKMPYFAANNHQWAIIDGLEMVNPNNNVILNAMHLKSFPTYKDIFIRPKKWTHNGITENKDIGFLNIFGIKHLWRTISLSIDLAKIIKRNKSENLTIVTYGIHTPFLFAAFIGTKFCNSRNVKWCSIVPEIPLFYIGIKGKGKLYNILKKIDWLGSLWLLKKANMYQLLTEDMARLLGIEDKDYIVIEGVLDTRTSTAGNENGSSTEQKKIVLYTGTTNVEFGIVDLLTAFSSIDSKDYKLVICGTGNGDIQIKEFMENDDRIEWKGFVTREEVLRLQKEATVLINPRRPDQEFTLYSFPSKTVEYLYSGTPVLMHKLGGIPPGYNEHLNFFENTNTDSIAKLIVEVCNWSKEKREDHARKAIEFIVSEKSLYPQGKKLYDFITSCF